MNKRNLGFLYTTISSSIAGMLIIVGCAGISIYALLIGVGFFLMLWSLLYVLCDIAYAGKSE